MKACVANGSVHMKNLINYNRILFVGSLGLRVTPDGGTVFADGSSLSFIVEELIALSAVSIVIPNSHPAAEFVSSLDPLIVKRVQVVDEQKNFQDLVALLGPLTEEYSVDFDGGTFGCSAIDRVVWDGLAELYFALDMFLLAMTHRTELDISLGRLKSNVKTLRHACRNPSSRAILSSIEGVLNTYQTLNCKALYVNPHAKPQLVNVFNDLIEDSAYRNAAKQAHTLGIPAKALRALTIMGRCLEDILTRSPFKQLFNLGGRAIEASTNIPIPASDVAKELLSRGFLPPIISTQEAFKQAKRAWNDANVQPMPPECPE